MQTSALLLMRLLENLLEWSMFQRGITKFEPEVTYLNTEINAISELMKEYADVKGILIKVEVPTHFIVLTDRHMFDTVMRNLISNAVKYSSKDDEIVISASSAEDHSIVVSVKDKGIGMNEEQLGHLFEFKSQVNRKGTSGEPTTGLGLILCKEFAERNGGKVWAESIENKGSTFYVSLKAASC